MCAKRNCQVPLPGGVSVVLILSHPGLGFGALFLISRRSAFGVQHPEGLNTRLASIVLCLHLIASLK